MATFKVNGKPVEFKPGDMALTAMLRAGVYVPHFCYHPGLSPEGNCRICLVKSNQSRKLEVSCMTRCNEKLEIETEAPDVQAARRDVMEFLLINHPLDCPICDKAGECDLQDFTFKYRGGLSRFVDAKNIRHTKDLGPDVSIWGNRCIACSRCVRFCEEIPGTGELALVNRGDRSVIDIFPGLPIENPMSLCVVDVCPVGALIDKNFLFEQRVWLGEEKPTVCTSCSRGCNMTALTHQNEIKRFSPRPNMDVNGYWACDEGRFNVSHVSSPRRLVQGKGTVRELAAKLKEFAVVVSTSNTVEEMFLAKQLGGTVVTMTRSRGPKWVAKSGWTIESDGTSNAAFAELLFDRGELGDVKQLIWINAIPARAWDDAFEAAVAKLELFAVFDVLQWPIQRHAQFVFPGAAFAEKDGTVVNADGRIQRLRKVIEPPPGARPEIEVLQELLRAMGKRTRALSAEGVFREAAKEIQALAGLDYGKIGELGAPLHLVTA